MSRKAVLEVLEAKLKEALRNSAHRKELEIQYQADPVDQVCSRIDREMTVKRLNLEAQLIQDLRSAIARFHSNGFGIVNSARSQSATNGCMQFPGLASA
jgi:RNA polymerase-binding transcription factor DksA